ncbi:cache domain-containing sensor histidine kinase [Paenibacillus beijingensis]
MKRSLSRTVFIYFFVVILFSLSTVGFFSYLESSRAIDEQVEKYVTQVINNALLQTDNHLKTFERLSNSILSQQIVKRFLDMDPEDSYEYYRFQNEVRKNVLQKIFITYPTQINMIYILGYHGRSIFDDNQNFSANTVDPSDRLRELIEKTPEQGEIAIMNTSLLEKDQGHVITIARKIRGYNSYAVKGILAIEIKDQPLTSLWSTVDLGEQGFFFILNDNGNVVYAPETDRLGDVLQTDISQRVQEGNERFIRNVRGEPMMFVSRKSGYSGWSLVVSLPVKELRAPISSIRSTTIAVGIVTLVVALFLAVRFGRSIVRPLRHLRESMRETEKGNWSSISGEAREDEIGGLIHSYNVMVSRLSEMIERVYRAELREYKTQLELQNIQLERQRAEFQALQLQINPHFLYNTLETINCYAIVQDSDDISEMVAAMAYMLRYSIQTNLEEITIANELNHVRNYMMILKHRIGREFEIDVIVPPKLLLEKTVRLTLQPIVENIFQHAFADGIEPHHFVCIDARKEDGYLQITVEDNGVGIEAEKLRQLQERLRRNRLADTAEETEPYKRGGIGLINVHRRIQMVYGDEFGIRIESTRDFGTKIMMTMPL